MWVFDKWIFFFTFCRSGTSWRCTATLNSPLFRILNKQMFNKRNWFLKKKKKEIARTKKIKEKQNYFLEQKMKKNHSYVEWFLLKCSTPFTQCFVHTFAIFFNLLFPYHSSFWLIQSQIKICERKQTLIVSTWARLNGFSPFVGVISK